MRFFAIVAFFFVLAGPSLAQTKGACDLAYEEFLELRKPAVEKADKAYKEWETYYDGSKKDRVGNIIKDAAGVLKFWDLSCIYRKAAVERAETLVALTPKPQRLCLGKMDAPCDTACWKKDLAVHRKAAAEVCGRYEKLRKK